MSTIRISVRGTREVVTQWVWPAAKEINKNLDPDMPRMSRRRFLASIGATFALGFAASNSCHEQERGSQRFEPTPSPTLIPTNTPPATIAPVRR